MAAAPISARTAAQLSTKPLAPFGALALASSQALTPAVQHGLGGTVFAFFLAFRFVLTLPRFHHCQPSPALLQACGHFGSGSFPGRQRSSCCGLTHPSPRPEICASQAGVVQSFASPSQHKLFPFASPSTLNIPFSHLQGTEGVSEGRDSVATGGSVLQHGQIRGGTAGLQGGSRAAAFQQGHPTGTGEPGARAGSGQGQGRAG